LGIHVQSESLHTIFGDGGNLINLINHLEPNTIPEEMISFNEVEDTELAIRLATDRFNIPPLILAEDLAAKDFNDQELAFAYLSFFQVRHQVNYNRIIILVVDDFMRIFSFLTILGPTHFIIPEI
jgi:hypothetical protein